MASENQLLPGAPAEALQDAPIVEFRPSKDRPVYKLSVRLIDTYKHINRVYYEARAQRNRQSTDANRRGGIYNDGYDDQQYDYILQNEEVFADRYILKHRIGKGSFGQVVCAYDQHTSTEVAIKIIKSRRPFMVQAQTEIALLEHIDQADLGGEYNVVKMINKFVFRNHQCLVFEMLSYNLYELLKNTKFKGVSLNLIRKFSRQILKSLAFLAKPEVDIIHCDLKPENILLRHPRRSAIKLIDFGSSCYANKRMYTYIQSRFYRSPEVLLGLSYDQKIDVWSLGCVLVEMHTGEPLFGGSDQCDQMCRIVDILGMPPVKMIEGAPEENRNNYFEKVAITNRGPRAALPGVGTGPTKYQGGEVNDQDAVASIVDPLFDIVLGSMPSNCDKSCVRLSSDGNFAWVLKRVQKEGTTQPPKRSLHEIIGVYTGGPHGRHEGNDGHSVDKYLQFLDFIGGLLRFGPRERESAASSMNHPYIVDDQATIAAAAAGGGGGASSSSPRGQAGASAAATAAAAGGSQAMNVDGQAAGGAEGDGEQRGRTQVEWKPRVRSRSAPNSNTKPSGDKGHITTTSAAVSRQNVNDSQPSPSKQAKTGPGGQNLFPQAVNTGKASGPGNASSDMSAGASNAHPVQGGTDANTSAGGDDADDSTAIDDATTTESRA